MVTFDDVAAHSKQEHNAEPYTFMGDNRWPAKTDKLAFAWYDYSISVKARITASALYPADLVLPSNNCSRIVKGVSGWQTGTGITPDQPAGTGGGGQAASMGGCMSRSSCGNVSLKAFIITPVTAGVTGVAT